MNLRNSWIEDILKFKHDDLTIEELKKKRNYYRGKSNNEICEIWDSVRCYIDAEELYQEYQREMLCEEYNIF